MSREIQPGDIVIISHGTNDIEYMIDNVSPYGIQISGLDNSIKLLVPRPTGWLLESISDFNGASYKISFKGKEFMSKHYENTLGMVKILQQLNILFESMMLYIPGDNTREYAKIISAYKPITSKDREMFYTIMKKFTWYRVFPVNHYDGLWQTF